MMAGQAEELEPLYREAEQLTRAGRYQQAADIYRGILSWFSDYGALVGLARAFEYQGDIDGAQESYRRASSVCPGLARPFTRRAMLTARAIWGGRTARPAGALDRPRLSMTTLGQNGRFGNQILQYGFLRLCADLNDLELELPDWLGRDLFGADEPFPSRHLPERRESEADLLQMLTTDRTGRLSDIDLWGYCQVPTGHLALHRDRWLSSLTWAPAVSDWLERCLAPLDATNRTLVSVHVRRGDFGGERFWRSPTGWYISALRELWPSLQDPVLYIASDDPEVASDFHEFPILSARKAIAVPESLEFLVDFEMLRRADILAISNSSFSFTAAMLNRTARRCLRPVRSTGCLEPFDPWDAKVLL